MNLNNDNYKTIFKISAAISGIVWVIYIGLIFSPIQIPNFPLMIIFGFLLSPCAAYCLGYYAYYKKELLSQGGIFFIMYLFTCLEISVEFYFQSVDEYFILPKQTYSNMSYVYCLTIIIVNVFLKPYLGVKGIGGISGQYTN